MQECLVCRNEITGLVLVKNRLIAICNACGGIVVDSVTVLQMDVDQRSTNEFYIIAKAMATLFREIGNIESVPVPE